MKREKSIRLIVFAVLTLVASPAVMGGEKGGNGGDGFASHFSGIGRNVGKAFKLICDGQASVTECAFLNEYLLAVESAEVVSADRVYGPDKKERDATNNGSNSIQVSRERWLKIAGLKNSKEHYARVVIHEYLSLRGLETSDAYPRSNALIQLLRNNFFSLDQLVGAPPAPQADGWAQAADIPFGSSSIQRNGCHNMADTIASLTTENAQVQSKCEPQGDGGMLLKTKIKVADSLKGKWVKLADWQGDYYGYCSSGRTAVYMRLFRLLSNDRVAFKVSCRESYFNGWSRDDYEQVRTQIWISR